MSNKRHLVVVDGETLSEIPWNALVVNWAATHHVIDLDDPDWNIPDFEELNVNGFFAKFDIRAQMEMGRKSTDSCLDWWKTLPQDVQDQLKPNGTELHPKTAIQYFVAWLKDRGVVPGEKVTVWCRGQDFDMTMMRSLLYNLYGPGECDKVLPYKFTKQRDIRTWVAAAFADPDKCWIPLKIPQFKQHDAQHDVSRAMIELVVALGLLQGKDVPDIVGE